MALSANVKLHLPARAPNEGARLLAQWALRQGAGRLPFAASRLGTTVVNLQRMVAGEIVPGLEIGHRLNRLTGARARDFRVEPRGRWFDASTAIATARQAA